MPRRVVDEDRLVEVAKAEPVRAAREHDVEPVVAGEVAAAGEQALEHNSEERNRERREQRAQLDRLRPVGQRAARAREAAPRRVPGDVAGSGGKRDRRPLRGAVVVARAEAPDGVPQRVDEDPRGGDRGDGKQHCEHRRQRGRE